MGGNIFTKYPLLAKGGLILGLILVLQIGASLIEGLISERLTTKSFASAEVGRAAGGRQIIFGPILTIRSASGSIKQQFPEELTIKSSVKVEKRYRGIFEIPAYVGEVTLEGTFGPLSKDSLIATEPNVSVIYPSTSLSLGIANPITLLDQATLAWDGTPHKFEPSVEAIPVLRKGIHAPLIIEESAWAQKHTFSITLKLGGSESFSIIPCGEKTNVSVTSNWKDPSFSGEYLPLERKVTDQGFEARWFVSDLGQDFSRVKVDGQLGTERAIEPLKLGIEFLTPIDIHRMSSRALKYELLFVVLTFSAFFLFEVICKLRIHGIQYLLIGGAIVLFYLLLLSLSEHIGFGAAYLAASIVAIVMVTGYSRSVLKQANRSWIIGALLSALYGFFYTVLRDQDFALLMGSTGTTFVLALVMYLTRNVDWYSLSAPKAREENQG